VGYYDPYGQPYYPPAQPALPTSTMAVISLISGILGFTALPVLGSIVAIMTGYMARTETRAYPPRASGDGLASAGIIMGWIAVGLSVVSLVCGLCFFVGVPLLLALFSQPVSSSAALGGLRI
jgi:hypothetical protein